MKYLPGMLVGQLSGSQGSQTASHNRNGPYLRSRVVPVNPATQAQMAVRGNFIALATQWRLLTAAQQADWGILGEQMVRTDALGAVYTLSGFQAYMAVNMRRWRAGLAGVVDAPAWRPVSNISISSVVYDVGAGNAFTVAFSGFLNLTETVKVFATPHVSAGRFFFGTNEYRWIQTFPSGPLSPLDILAAYTARFPGATPGEKVSVRLVVDSDNFTDRADLRADTIVVST